MNLYLVVAFYKLPLESLNLNRSDLSTFIVTYSSTFITMCFILILKHTPDVDGVIYTIIFNIAHMYVTFTTYLCRADKTQHLNWTESE